MNKPALRSSWLARVAALAVAPESGASDDDTIPSTPYTPRPREVPHRPSQGGEAAPTVTLKRW